MKLFRLVAIAALCTVLLSLNACQRSKTIKQSAASFKITSLFYPQYIMLLNIIDGTDSQLSLLAPPDTGCLHDYQLTTRDMQNIESADVIVINGAGMESFAEKILADKGTINASKDIAVIEENPHLWVSPHGAAAQTENISIALAEGDPKNAEAYRNNAKKYMQKLGELNHSMHAELDPYAESSIVVFHEAFPYFADEFDFKIAGTIEHEPGTEPSAKELLETIKIIRDAQSAGENPVLFAEKQYPSTAADVIGRETGLAVYELDSAVTGTLQKDSYIIAMQNNVLVFKRALGAKK